MARRSLFSAISSAAAILILAAGCSDLPTTVELDPASIAIEDASLGMLAPPNIVNAAKGHLGGQFSEVIGSEGGTIEFAGGSLTFPADALAGDTEITAEVHPTKLAVTFGTHGLQFPADAQPTLSISYAGTGAGDDLKVLYLAPNGAVQEDLGGTVNSDFGTVSVTLQHFSAYVIATG